AVRRGVSIAQEFENTTGRHHFTWTRYGRRRITSSCSNRASTAEGSTGGTVPMPWYITALIVAPPRLSSATTLPPGWPSWLPSISRPEVSSSPEGGRPLTWSWTGLDSLNGFLSVSVTVSFAALYAADFSVMTLAFLA